jgi:integrase
VFAEEHWAAHSLTLAADTTRVVKRTRLDRHILPTLGDYPLAALRPSTVSAALGTWLVADAGPRHHRAGPAPGPPDPGRRVADGLIASNPAKAVTAPPAPRRRDVHLTDEDVAAVLVAAPPPYRALVITLIGLGLRISEACGLRVQDVDFLRRTVRSASSAAPAATWAG